MCSITPRARRHSSTRRKPPASVRSRSPPGPPWGAGPVDYVSQVQPILDRHCVKCHSGAEAERGIDLTGDKTRFFSMSYESLTHGGHVRYYYINKGPNGVFPALGTGSWVSKLTKLLESNHGEQKVEVDDRSRRCIYAWVEKFNDFASRSEDRVRKIYLGGGNRFGDRGLINLTRPESSPVLLDLLSRSAGGRANEKDAYFRDRNDPRYRELLAILEEAKAGLYALPRMDMVGGTAIPQERNFGRTF